MIELNILVSTDTNYVKILKTMLCSLFCNNSDCKTNIHVLHSELSVEDVASLRDFAEKYGAEAFFYKMGREYKELLKDDSGLPSETFYRLFIANIIPKHISKIIYLDCDIIINGSLKELYSTPLYETDGEGRITKHYLFAAAEDRLEQYPENSRFRLSNRNRLNLPESKKYINSGVLLINVEFLRTFMTAEELLNLVKESLKIPGLLIFHDQDFINLYFNEYIKYLDYRIYNFNPSRSTKDEKYWEERRKKPPIIIHYAGRKPWNDDFPVYNKFLIEAKGLFKTYSEISNNTNYSKNLII